MNNIIVSPDIGQLRQMIPAGTNVVVLYDRNVTVWMEQVTDPSDHDNSLMEGKD